MDVIEAARARPYQLGEHDCFRVACQVIEALTGIDRWPEFFGYRTRREAMAKLAHYGSTFEKAGDWFFGVPHTDWKRAQRGDIACVEDGDKHLGVVLGHEIAFLSDSGLVFLPLTCATCVWHVG